MSNEELAILIKQGREDLYPELWEQVRCFIVQQARRRCEATKGFGGVEVDDLVQSGYFALIKAVNYYEDEKECCFLSILGNCLKTEFAIAGGYRSGNGDPLDYARSLDEQLDEEEPKSTTRIDMLADPHDYIEETDHSIWLQDLKKTMKFALSSLPVKERKTLSCRFYKKKTYKETGEVIGTSGTEARAIESNALRRLRQENKELRDYIDIRTPFYFYVSVAAFQATHTSAVEKIVFKRAALEQEYYRGEA